MNETFEKIKAYITANPLLAVFVALAAVLLFFPKLLRGATRRRRRRAALRPVVRRRRIIRVSAAPRPRRRSYTQGGKAKKAWQVKGSRAAKLHMARIRRMR
jgi:hypothetical protein